MLKNVFGRYYEEGDQSIDFSKTVIYFIKDMNARTRRKVSRVLSILEGTMHFKYQGVSIGSKRVPLRYFEGSLSNI